MGLGAAAIHSQLLSMEQGLLHTGRQGLDNHFQTRAGGDGGAVDAHTRTHTCAGQDERFKGHFVVQSSMENWPGRTRS